MNSLPLLPHLQGAEPYVPGAQINESGWVKLNTNENPFPPSPRIEAAIREQIDRLHLYPEPTSRALRESVGRRFGLSADHVIVGNGSDDVLNLATRCYSGPEQAIGWMVPSYSLYPILAQVQGAPLIGVPFDESFQFKAEAALNSCTRLFFLTSPNAPSGVALDPVEVIRFIESYPGVVVIDEAYVDFSGHSFVGEVKRFPNLLVTRTFSKSYGLAGLRVGFGVGQPQLIEHLNGVREAYNVDRLAQAAALAAWEDKGYTDAILSKIRRIRDYHLAVFRQYGWFTYPSATNFIFARPTRSDGSCGPDVALDLFEHLKREKILIRRFPGHPLTDAFLRFSIGDESAMLRLTDAIESWQTHA
jgi:histidinol-phosphate aminotransferase